MLRRKYLLHAGATIVGVIILGAILSGCAVQDKWFIFSRQREAPPVLMAPIVSAKPRQYLTPEPEATAAVTLIEHAIEEEIRSTPIEPTAVPEEELTPTPEKPEAENTPDMRRELLVSLLPAYLMSGSYQELEGLMGDPFVISYWQSENQAFTLAEAVEQLRFNLLPDSTTFRFTNDESLFPDLGDEDPKKAFGPRVKIVDLVYSAGWGLDGQGEAILAIGLNLDGQYWPGMIYAPAGFEERMETDDESEGETITYINEHAGYAFDYPADWLVSGEPNPKTMIYVITVQSFKLSSGTGPVPEDEVKLDFVTCNSAECDTLAEIQDRVDGQAASGELEITSEESWTLAGGIPAIRRRMIGEMGLEMTSLLTEIDGKLLRVGGYGDLDAVDEILRTVRPAGVNITAGSFSNDKETAQDSLIRYFTLLSEGNYAGAAELYGGGYDVLIDWNPTADPDDLAGLLKMGCLENGLVCLPMKTITLLGTSIPDKYEFALQFERSDGGLLVLDPEGDWPASSFPKSSFEFTVTKAEDRFVVQELPITSP